MEQQDRPVATARDDDQVSFIDLLAIIIRRRKILLGIPAAAFVLALTYFYIAPALGIYARDSYLVEVTVAPAQIPPSIRNEMGLDLPSYAMLTALAPGNLAGPVWAMGLKATKSMSGADDPVFLAYLRGDFIGKKYNCSIGVNGSLLFSVKQKDRAIAETFLRSMLELVDLRLREDVSKRARIIADSMESILAESEKKGLPVTIEARQMFLASRVFTGTDVSIFQTLSGFSTSREPDSRKNDLLLVFIVGIILGLLAAVAAEVIAYIRDDEDAMRRIRAARTNGKQAR